MSKQNWYIIKEDQNLFMCACTHKEKGQISNCREIATHVQRSKTSLNFRTEEI